MNKSEKMNKGRTSLFIYTINIKKDMIVEINDRIKQIINSMPYNKTVKSNAIKIYGALWLLSQRKNKHGYFSVPSEYLKSINVRYFKIIDWFEQEGLIKAYTRPYQDDNDIFLVVDRKYYDKTKGICMKYKFLLPTEGHALSVDVATNRHLRWYSIIEQSLIESGYEVKIKRDTFGRRVHHSAIQNYKEDFSGYWTIDAVASQPRLLYLDMKDKGMRDNAYFDIFENDKDFYLELQYMLKLDSKSDAKDLFMHWVNGKGYVPNFNIHNIFPAASAYIKCYKKGDYKTMASHLQRVESKIWIDDILGNLPAEWALPVHDSIILKEEDVESVEAYIRSKYPEMKIKTKQL